MLRYLVAGFKLPRCHALSAFDCFPGSVLLGHIDPDDPVFAGNVVAAEMGLVGAACLVEYILVIGAGLQLA